LLRKLHQDNGHARAKTRASSRGGREVPGRRTASGRVGEADGRGGERGRRGRGTGTGVLLTLRRRSGWLQIDDEAATARVSGDGSAAC
jgi:hypothetical protein